MGKVMVEQMISISRVNSLIFGAVAYTVDKGYIDLANR